MRLYQGVGMIRPARDPHCLFRVLQRLVESSKVGEQNA
jgi:hypothetical protein